VHSHDPSEHAHHHDFSVGVGQGERRTRAVVILTVAMMVAELVVGSITNSLALVADGWHMATHAGALGLALFAYWYARTRAGSDAYTFGTGKVYALAGFASGVVLGVVALWMMAEAVARLFEHPTIDFADALPVAALGLIVNVASMVLLSAKKPKAHDHDHDHHDHDHDHGHHHHHHHHHDHNLRAAYLHVVADALTSVLAIGALLAGRYAGLWWLDPTMAIIGGLLIARWSVGLCRDASRQLLDAVPSPELARRIAVKLEAIDDVRVADLHLWEIAPGRQGCIVSLVTGEPRDTTYYRDAILAEVSLAHLTVEVHRCDRGHELPAA
jgi:cation diffusion facilitator family transporter